MSLNKFVKSENTYCSIVDKVISTIKEKENLYELKYRTSPFGTGVGLFIEDKESDNIKTIEFEAKNKKNDKAYNFVKKLAKLDLE